MTSSVQKQYNDIAFIYDLLSEGDDVMLYFRMYAEKEIAKLHQSAKILDCSCGTGDHAIWLARQGFEVFASDISEDMVARALDKAKAHNLLIRFFQSSWEELAKKTDQTFDLVVCPGNSIAHIEELASLTPTFRSIKKVLKPGASFFFDIRNWEKTFEEASLATQDFEVEKDTDIYHVRYSYNIKGWNTPCTMFVDIKKDGEDEHTHYPFHFLPLAYQHLHDALSEAGFSKIEKAYYPSEDYYFIIAS